MVRVNLIQPSRLSDQHLIAEYDEILMLVAYIKNKPSIDSLPQNYCLGKGHMRFFKDKVNYLKERHELLKKEMVNRGFKTEKTIDLDSFDSLNKGIWQPGEDDFKIIKARIKEKLALKPTYYRYYSKYKSTDFFFNLLDN